MQGKTKSKVVLHISFYERNGEKFYSNFMKILKQFFGSSFMLCFVINL